MNSKVKNMSYCSIFVVIVIIMAQIKIQLPSVVPLTLQTLGIYLMGCLLKPKLALLASLVYILMGAIGLPVFAGTTGGLAILLGPTGGYIFSFPLVALIISVMTSSKDDYYLKILSMIIGTIVCYLIGTIWFMFITNASFIAALSICVLPFLIGDIIKIVLATIISSKIKKL